MFAPRSELRERVLVLLFPGRIDEIMLCRRALSGDEIGRLYAGALFRSPPINLDAGAD